MRKNESWSDKLLLYEWPERAELDTFTVWGSLDSSTDVPKGWEECGQKMRKAAIARYVGRIYAKKSGFWRREA